MGCDIVLGEWFQAFWRDHSALNQLHSITSQKTSSNIAVRTSDLTVFVLFEQVVLERSIIVYLAFSDWIVGWRKTYVVWYFPAVGRSNVPMSVNEKLHEMHPVLEM
jgi:hypothetical protein